MTALRFIINSMVLQTLQAWLRVLATLAAWVFLWLALRAVWRGLRRPLGRTTGLASQVLRPGPTVLIGVAWIGVCALLWHPLPLVLSPLASGLCLLAGGLLYFPGLGLYLWGGRVLGDMWGAASSLGVRLPAQARLVTIGPFAYVRHPLYLGLNLAALGGLLLFRTWTLVFISASFLTLVWRARREEQALAAEFADTWHAYSRRVPAWLPRLHHRP